MSTETRRDGAWSRTRLGALVMSADLAFEYDLGIAEHANEVANLAPEWQRLFDASTSATPFQSPAYALAAIETLVEPRATPMIVTARREGRLAAVLPLVRSREGGLRIARLIGAPYTQYDDAIVDPSHPRALEAILGTLVDRAHVDAIVFRRVREDAAIAALMKRIGRPLGEPDAAPFVGLAQHATVDALLASLSGKKRQNLRIARRKIEELGPIGFAVHHGEAARVHVMTAIAMKRRWLEANGKASAALTDERAGEFLARFGERAGSALAVSELSVGDRVAAYEIALRSGGRWHAFLGAMDPDLAPLGPGKVQMLETLRWAIAERVEVYDLLPPDDEYKARWTTSKVAVRDYGLPLTIAGTLWLDLWQGRLRPAAKRAFERLPAGLRKIVAPMASKG